MTWLDLDDSSIISRRSDLPTALTLAFALPFSNGHLASEHEDNGHLEEHAEYVAYVVAVELLGTLITVTALQEECAAHVSLHEALLKIPCLRNEYNQQTNPGSQHYSSLKN